MAHQEIKVTYSTEKSEWIITPDTFTECNVHISVKSTFLKIIHVKNEYVTKLDVSECIHLEKLICSGANLRELITNQQLLSLYCANNKLTALSLNRNLIELYCGNNKITQLNLNRNLRVLHCEENELTDITLNKRLEILVCDHNLLTAIEINPKLEFLSCANNLITKLKLNRCISTVHCKDNRLTSLIVNEKMYDQIMMHKYPPFLTLPTDIPIFKCPKTIPNDFICAICLDENAEDIIVTDCNHIFHVNCILLIRNVSCPFCRRPIRQLI